MNDILYGHGDGFLTQDGRRLFPIGFYEHPAEDDALRDMAEAGVNLIRCGNTDSLDRAQATRNDGMGAAISSIRCDTRISGACPHPCRASCSCCVGRSR